MESPKINFRGFKFRDSNQSSDDVIDTRALNLARNLLSISHTYRDLDK